MNVKKVEAMYASPEVIEELPIPLCIDDIISICKEYNNLGANIQNYMDTILDFGVDRAIKMGKINQQFLPHIKSFLISVSSNPLFGEAGSMADDIIQMIEIYENNKPKSNVINLFVN